VKVEVLDDATQVARRGAEILADCVRAVVAERDACRLALSGGTTPWQMLRDFAETDLPWRAVHVFQVDERVAPIGDPHRNLTHLRESLATAPLASSHLHPMPVGRADLESAAADYARELSAPLDLVHLGLGADGHTASLVPGDPVCEVEDRDVAVTGAPYEGYRRMTLTHPVLRRAARVLWLVTGEAKGPALARLRAADPTIPAGRVPQDRALLLVDRAAAERS
jgi:6-phosphogluconolactonase